MNEIMFFSSYPFTKNGIETPFFGSVREKNDYFQRLQHKTKYIDTLIFAKQGEIVVEYEQDLTKTNYIRILTNFKTNDGKFDEELFYFVDDINVIQSENGEADSVIFRISIDEMNTHFFENDGNTGNTLKLPALKNARLTGYTGIDYLRTHGERIEQVLPYIYDTKYDEGTYTEPSTKFIIGKKHTHFCPVISFVNPEGSIQQRVITNSGNGLSQDQVIVFSNSVGRITQIAPLQGQGQNISILHAYILPIELIDFELLLNETDKFIGGGVSYNCSAINYTKTREKGFYAVYSLQTGHNPNVWNVTHFLKTSKRIIEIANDSHLIPVFVGISDTGSERISVSVFMNGTFVEIADDFEMSIAVNSQMEKMAYDRTSVALDGLAKIIGGAVGAIAGFASGNIVGAGGAVADTVSYFLKRQDSLDNPATIRTNGDIISAINSFGGFTVFGLSNASNKDVSDAITAYFGVKCNAFVFNLTIKKNDFVSCETMDVVGVTEETATAIVNKFKGGIKFVGV